MAHIHPRDRQQLESADVWPLTPAMQRAYARMAAAKDGRPLGAEWLELLPVFAELYELIDKARLTSQIITLLLHQLQALLSVVALVKIVLDEHQHSHFATEDGHGLPNVQTLLFFIEQDFRHLKGISDNTIAPSRLGWLSTLHTSLW